MSRFQVMLEQSGMPETTTHVMAQGIRRMNGAQNEAQMQFEDAANNMLTHTDLDGGEKLQDVDYSAFNEYGFDKAIYQYGPDGRVIRYRRVYIKRKDEERE